MRETLPQISVIIPVFNSRDHLEQALKSLSFSTHPPLEILVIDDGSTDQSPQVAHALGARVITLDKRGGPARARNHGAAIANGEILFFVDADVCVRPETLHRIALAFDTDRTLAALIGSYDDDPQTQDFLSQYRNLMHHFIHQRGRESASTFWSGCGAIRKTVFQKFSGFDESYNRPAIEDIELGYRLQQSKQKILLDHDLTVKHLKKWTFLNLIKSDIFDRGIPWTELIFRDRFLPNDLNLQLSQRVSVALAFLIVGVAALAAIRSGGYTLTPLFALIFFLLARFLAGEGSAPRSRMAVIGLVGAMLAIAAMAAAHHMFGLIPLLFLSQILLFMRHRYEGSTIQRKRWLRPSALLYMAFSILACIYYFPNHSLTFLFFLLAACLGLLNTQFYLFLAAKRGIFFALAAIPFHMLFHFYNGIAFLIGAIRFWLNGSARSASTKISEPQPDERRRQFP